MEHHDCKTPKTWPVAGTRTWQCPECHDFWRVEPLGSTSPSSTYTFLPDGGGYPGPVPAEWIRIGQNLDP